jgi:VWFA-related protein
MQSCLRVTLAIVLVISALTASAAFTGQDQSRKIENGYPPAKTTSADPSHNPSATSTSQGPETDVVRVDTDLVNTIFTAIDKDRHFLTTLRPEDLRISENGVEQNVALFERETDRPLSVAILIDTSESQRGVLVFEKSTALTFVNSVIRPARDRAAILSFTGSTKIQQDLTNELAKLRLGIERVQVELSAEIQQRLESKKPMPSVDEDPTGYTGVWDAIWITVKEVLSSAPEQTRKAIILLSDGDDTSSKVPRDDAVHFAVATNVAIYSLGIRDKDFHDGKLQKGLLSQVSERTGGRAFFPLNEDELQIAFSQINDELRSQYVIGYSPTNKARDGSYRRIKIEITNSELRKRKVQLLYRQGYYAKKK